MLVGLPKYGFWVVRIPNISDGYPSAFQYVVFSACPSICLNTSLPRLNFIFMLS